MVKYIWKTILITIILLKTGDENMKFSKKREMILEFVKSSPEHYTADFIYSQLKKDHPELSLGTVYRNLTQLVENGLIRKISLKDKADVFDRNLEEHGHLLCSMCGSIYDIDIMPLEEAVKEISTKENISINLSGVTFHGICSNCKH